MMTGILGEHKRVSTTRSKELPFHSNHAIPTLAHHMEEPGFQMVNVTPHHYEKRRYYQRKDAWDVFFHGELHNHAALAHSLGLHEKETSAAIFMNLWETYKTESFSMLEGAYVVVIRERHSGRVWIARDWVGALALFYVKLKNCLVFSTHTRPLRELVSGISIRSRAVVEYLLFNHPLAPGTYYEEIHSLEPGANMSWDQRKGLQKNWGDHTLKLENHDSKGLKDQLASVVQGHMTQFPKTIFQLSGGLDTSLLCHLACEVGTPKILTAGYQEHAQHEDLRYARKVAHDLSLNGEVIDISSEAFYQSIPELITFLDGPIMAMGAPTFWFMARHAHRHGFEAMVTGVGGDHAFIGDTRLGTNPPQWKGASTLFNKCLHVDLKTLSCFFPDPSPVMAEVRRLQKTFSLPQHISGRPTQQIERFFFFNFLQEHLRMTEQLHRFWGIVPLSPFLEKQALLLAVEIERHQPSPYQTKQLMRQILHQFDSQVAGRLDKAQMSLPYFLFRRGIRQELEDACRQNTILPGLSLQTLSRFLAKPKNQPKPGERLIWALYNLHIWFQQEGFRSHDLLFEPLTNKHR